MKKFFLPVYTIVVFSIVIWFALYGEHRDPRFYVSIFDNCNHWEIHCFTHRQRKIVIDVELPESLA